MSQEQTAAKSVLVFFVTGIIGLVGLVTWSSIQAQNVPTISALRRTPAGQVALGIGPEIFLLDAKGAITFRRLLPKEDGDTHNVALNDIAFDAQGHYVVADRGNARIKKYAPDHTLSWQAGGYGTGKGEFWGPMKLAVQPATGQVYATDTSGHRLHLVDAHGHLVDTIGGKGRGLGQLWFPNGIQVDDMGHVVIVNTNNRRLDWFDANGVYQAHLPLWDKGAQGYPYPIFAARDALGAWYILMGARDQLEPQKLYKLAPAGASLVEFNAPQFPGKFVGPIVIGDRVLLADWGQRQLLAFTLDGAYIGPFGAAPLPTLLQALNRRESMYHELRRAGQIVLVLSILTLLVLYVLQTRKDIRDTADARSDLRSRLPVSPMPQVRSAHAVLFYLSFFSIAVVVTLQLRAACRADVCRVAAPLSDVAPIALSVLILLGWVYIAAGNIVLRHLIRNKTKAIEKAARLLPSLVAGTETVVAVVLAHGGILRPGQKWGGASFAGLIVFATDQRLLILKTNMNRTRIRRLSHVAYADLVSVDLPARRGRWWTDRFGNTRLHLRTRAKQTIRLQSSRFELIPFGETIRALLAQPAPTWVESETQTLVWLCPRCQRKTTSSPAVCPACRTGRTVKTPQRAALLSLTYPGLGQLYNGALWKGIAFLVLHTGLAFYVLVALSAWYFQYTEISHAQLRQLTLSLLILWSLSILDAYHDFAPGLGP